MHKSLIPLYFENWIDSLFQRDYINPQKLKKDTVMWSQYFSQGNTTLDKCLTRLLDQLTDICSKIENNSCDYDEIILLREIINHVYITY